MKSLITKTTLFSIVAVLSTFPVKISEGQVLPVCSVVEVNTTKAHKQESTQCNINAELENYVIGVVAGEVPVTFPNEAIKAQAVAARTYAYRLLKTNPNLKYEDIAQAYITVDKMKSMWGNSFSQNYEKIKNNVFSTAGQIIEYNNEPILAAFCSTTNGYTESCDNVWSESLPYLTTVKSDGEEYSPYYKDTVTLSIEKFNSIFGNGDVSITARTEAGYVKSVTVGQNTYTGSKFRSMLGLRSTSFDITKTADSVVITTKGYGHGVGMSQYGACYMANNGSSYEDIIFHYYKGTNIKKI